MKTYPAPRTTGLTAQAGRLITRAIGQDGRLPAGVVRFFVIVAFVGAVSTLFYPASSASSLRNAARRGRVSGETAPPAAASAKDRARGVDAARQTAGQDRVATARPAAAFPMLVQAAPGPETIATYAADCTTPKTSFELGETVCAKVTNAPVGAGGSAAQRLTWVARNGSVAQAGNITSSTQTGTYLLPTTATQTLGGITIDNRGTWRVNTSSTADGSLQSTALFTVHDPAGSFADLVVNQGVSLAAAEVGTAGSTGKFGVTVTNLGPDAAQFVTFSQPVPTNTTFVSFTQTAGPTFNCVTPSSGGTGTVTCTAASLDKDASATFEFVYQLTTAGSSVTGTANVSSTTPDPDESSDSADASVVLPGGTPPATCNLTCPGNIVRTADTTQNGQPGAIVTFGAAEAAGECGTVTASPASGSFFPVGDTPVNVTSATGGGSCSFIVTVTSTAGPTISCPGNVTKDAGSDCTAIVTAQELGTPTTTGSNVTVDAERSDGLPLDSPYPAGNTIITWTATDDHGRTNSCPQTVTVNANDTTPPTIIAPPDITVGTGTDATSCSAVVAEDALGTATTDDNCTGAVQVIRTGIPAGNVFPKGTTTITYTAKDAAGNTSQPATQHVTVVDDTVPIIFAPADASYTCPSDVPAANPAQAGGPKLDANGKPELDANGNLQPGGAPYDNCGAPMVTVSQTSSGAGSASSPLVIHRTYTATDGSGNTASATQTITVIDNTPPTISCPANITVYLPLNSPAVSTPVSFTVGASDNCGTATVVSTPASGANFPVGTTTVNSTATDAAGNTSSCSFTVTVLYNFAGFFSPVSNLPTLNLVNAGRSVPMKFSLSGNKGLGIFAAGTPDSQQIACDTGAPLSDLQDTGTAGSSSLSYDAASDQYNYVWKTEGAWAGTCRQFVLQLNDGSVHYAKFKFR